MLLTKDEICCFCDALKKYDKVFLITDENVKHCCLPLLSDLLDTSIFIVITIEHGY